MNLTADILRHSIDLARSTGARAIIVYADVFAGADELLGFLSDTGTMPVILAAKTGGPFAAVAGAIQRIAVPGIRLTRLGQIKVAVLLGFSKGYFATGDRLVCLSGVAGSGVLDTIVVLEVGDEFEMFAAHGATEVARHLNPEVFERVLDLAIALGYEGREGRPVGTTFVIGDTARVLALSRQMVLNPFCGHPAEARNVLDPALEQTIKEFAAIDGAFVIDRDGRVEAAGVYLKSGAWGDTMPAGLGSRHQSAAGITAVTDAVAITVSESTGAVTVFREGRILVELERQPGGDADSLTRPLRVRGLRA